VNELYVHRNRVPGEVLVELDELVRDDGAWSVWGEEFDDVPRRRKRYADDPTRPRRAQDGSL
jgi:hypothetical protein